MKKLILIVILFLPLTSYGQAAWYFGKITRIWHYGADGFILKFDSNALSDCKHNYVYFSQKRLGEAHKNATYSMALSAFHAGQKVGVVINKSIGELCYAISLDMDNTR